MLTPRPSLHCCVPLEIRSSSGSSRTLNKQLAFQINAAAALLDSRTQLLMAALITATPSLIVQAALKFAGRQFDAHAFYSSQNSTCTEYGEINYLSSLSTLSIKIHFKVLWTKYF
jgi:hypothetical protein